MHGTYLTPKSDWKPDKECPRHHVPNIHDPVVGGLVYKVGDPVPMVIPIFSQRCPVCYPTREAMLNMCVKSFVRQWALTNRSSRLDRLVIVWKDGRKNEYQISK